MYCIMCQIYLLRCRSFSFVFTAYDHIYFLQSLVLFLVFYIFLNYSCVTVEIFTAASSSADWDLHLFLKKILFIYLFAFFNCCSSTFVSIFLPWLPQKAPTPASHPLSYPTLALSMGPLYMFLDDPFPSLPR